MVKRGPRLRPQASEGEAQHGSFCWTGLVGQGDQRLHCGRHEQDRSGSEGTERASSSAQSAHESVPIVFTNVPDPVGAGFVNSLARPGDNATGFMQLEYGMSGK
jgi:ABC transporter substrate binding protein